MIGHFFHLDKSFQNTVAAYSISWKEKLDRVAALQAMPWEDLLVWIAESTYWACQNGWQTVVGHSLESVACDHYIYKVPQDMGEGGRGL